MHIPESVAYKRFEESHFGRTVLETASASPFPQSLFDVLDDSSLARFWHSNFGNPGHKRRIPNEFWMFNASTTQRICQWTQSLESGDFGAVGDCLFSSCARHQDVKMCFFGGIEAILVTWGTFVRHWNSFVEFNDEGLLAELEKNSGLIVSPLGYFLDVSE